MFPTRFILIISLLALLVLQACGGGGGSSKPDNGGSDIVINSAVVDLTWETPTTRIDGGVLYPSSIDGYKIYYGAGNDSLSLLTDLDDASLESYRVSVPSEGNYYFAVSAYDTYGLESVLSNAVLKTATLLDN